MPPKPSNKRTAASMEAHDAKVTNWAKRLWGAIPEEATYSQDHEDFFKEFQKLRDVAEGLASTNVTMLDHVAPIYNHIASHGYDPLIHYPPLEKAVINYCEDNSVADWKGPSDQSRSPSPAPDASPPPNPRIVVTRRKAKAKIPDEVVRSEQDVSEEESAKPRKPLPNTDGMERNLTKCTLCIQRGHLCHVNPKALKAAACFECNHWRVKCSLTPPGPSRAKKTEAADPSVEEEVAAPRRRRKPTQVPAGQSGQFGGAFKVPFFGRCELIFSSLASLNPEILKKLESYESGYRQQLEKMEELSQAIAQLSSENRSTREWFQTRLKLVWESASNRDEAIVEAMKNILEHAEEMTRYFALREVGEKIEALLKDHPIASAAEIPPTATPLPAARSPSNPPVDDPSPIPDPATTTTTTIPAFPDGETSNKRPAAGQPTTTIPAFPDGETSNKRPAAGQLGESKKRRKIGEDA